MPSAPRAKEIVGSAVGAALMSFYIAFTHTHQKCKSTACLLLLDKGTSRLKSKNLPIPTSERVGFIIRQIFGGFKTWCHVTKSSDTTNEAIPLTTLGRNLLNEKLFLWQLCQEE